MILERNSENAAAYTTLRVHVTPEKTTRATDDTTRVHFILGPTWQPPQGGKPQSLAKLRQHHREGKLSPAHPLCRQLVTSANRVALIRFLADPRTGYRATEKDGIWHITPAPGQGLPGLESVKGTTTGVFKTPNIRTALALITAGHALIAIEGDKASSTFYLHHHGPEGTAAHLLTTWRTAPETMPHDSIFLLSMAFLQNREILISHVNHLLGRVLLQKPNTTRSILLPENASGRTWDKAKKFLLG
jgi:hypothetical protein